MNKKQIEQKFKQHNRIEWTRKNWKSNEQLKQELKDILKKGGINPDELQEDNKAFSYGQHVFFKTIGEKVQIIEFLPLNVTGKNIINYGDDFVETELSYFKLI